MKKSVFSESLKALVAGVIIGLLVMCFGKLDSFKVPVVLGIIAISIYARNNVYQKKE
jgi:hypothetical protein